MSDGSVAWEIEYEQTPATEAWAYRFDHEPAADGLWRPISTGSAAHYRIARPVAASAPPESPYLIQYVCPMSEIPAPEWQRILTALARAGPLAVAGTVELILARDQHSYRMTSHWIDLAPGPTFPALTREHLNESYARLVSLEDQHD